METNHSWKELAESEMTKGGKGCDIGISPPVSSLSSSSLHP